MSHRKSLSRILKMVKRAEARVSKEMNEQGLDKNEVPEHLWEAAVIEEMEKMKK